MLSSKIFVLVAGLVASFLAAGLVYSVVHAALPLHITTFVSRHQRIAEMSATSGTLFQGIKIRDYVRPVSRDQADPDTEPLPATQLDSSLKCTRWAVVTTIFEPSEAVIKMAGIPSWCLVVVGDAKGPSTYNLSHYVNTGTLPDTKMTVTYLSEQDQLDLAASVPFVKELPWNHFGRKNVGYLYAIMRGARVIWDFDDDNLLLQDSVIPSVVASLSSELTFVQNATITVYEYDDDGKTPQLLSFNPYPLMGAPSLPSWPRGLPLGSVKASNDPEVLRRGDLRPSALPVGDVAVVQSLANHDPDVDAIYRLTQPLPFSFHFPKHAMHSGSLRDSTDDSQSSPVFFATPSHRFTPYNAQATLHAYDAFWALYLPVTVHGRVSDIWRAYIFEAVARGTGLRLLFSSPIVAQYRNAHNYLADLQSESDLYHKTERLLQQLNSEEWAPQRERDSFAQRLMDLYVRLYEHSYVELRDVEMVELWIKALTDAGYRFPDHRLSKA